MTQNKLVFLLKKEAPQILTGLGVTGVVATAIFSARAAPKAYDLIREVNSQRVLPTGESNDMEFIEEVKLVWPIYIPTMISGLLTIGFILASNRISIGRQAALVGAYSAVEYALREYKDKVVEVVGEKKARAVIDEVAQSRLDSSPIDQNPVYRTSGGDVLFFDTLSGRYFRSDLETVRRAVNDFNADLLNQSHYVVLNDLYYFLDLAGTDLGALMGWDIEHGVVKIDYSTKIATNGEPCIVMNHILMPRYL